ncbi:hypothetical protein XENOCAPTIV_011482, partial [Xenoophorus captivus]
DAIAQLTDVGSAMQLQTDGGRVTVFSDRTGMVKAARLLLSSVTKVLVLADRIVIKQIIRSRNKVKQPKMRSTTLNNINKLIHIHKEIWSQVL